MHVAERPLLSAGACSPSRWSEGKLRLSVGVCGQQGQGLRVGSDPRGPRCLCAGLQGAQQPSALRCPLPGSILRLPRGHSAWCPLLPLSPRLSLDTRGWIALQTPWH